MNTINSLFIYITFKCNLRCCHCWASCDSNVVENHLTINTMIATIKNAYSLGMRSLKITGGEPFVYKEEIIQIFDYLLDFPDINIRMETNGTLLDDSLIERINAQNVALSVSLHDFRSEMHDKFVGQPGAFLKVVHVLPKIKIKEVLVTVSKQNIEEIEKIFDLLHSLGVKKIKLNILLKVGRATMLENMELSVEDYKRLNDVIDKYIVHHDDIQIDSSTPLCIGSLSIHRPKHELAVGCSFGKVCCIVPNGDITMCGWSINSDNSQLKLGNIFDESLDVIWRRSSEIVNQIYPITGVCSKCIVGKICNGGCRAISYLTYGELNAPYPVCQTMFESGVFPKNRLI